MFASLDRMYPAQRDVVPLTWVLRVGVVMEFIGHGALGISRVAAWTSYFGVVGIPRDTALQLMPFVGLFDVALAVTVLFYPMRGVILYMAAWGLWTALLSAPGRRIGLGDCRTRREFRCPRRAIPDGQRRERAIVAAVSCCRT